ncbi:hypothetical protein [Laspinema olomoucense]|uniref:Uncharacterized protein n=1 Tax=Laspinema olomoucense D3b TaxID=2953688 RepID=A0ABT2N100_9CYAN|nr:MULTISPECIES: hypothetical protein [unclassified Laspinema]MCT7970837.1 hypothetical protein [Laspinema sp. D3d]MCT7976344.1 hypothetical protein [Laspinema sp. D3b]MCT7993781.1 hypothetical protein [Laspinema sp. D3c]
MGRQITISKLAADESEMKARSLGWRYRREGPPGEGDRIADSGLLIDAWGVPGMGIAECGP